MNDNPFAKAAMEYIKALENLTKLTGVRIDLQALEPRKDALRSAPKKPDLKVIK
jgi:hypothetical protein